VRRLFKSKEETGIDVGNMPMETVPETEELYSHANGMEAF
jgi:hypothetical protein